MIPRSDAHPEQDRDWSNWPTNAGGPWWCFEVAWNIGQGSIEAKPAFFKNMERSIANKIVGFHGVSLFSFFFKAAFSSFLPPWKVSQTILIVLTLTSSSTGSQMNWLSPTRRSTFHCFLGISYAAIWWTVNSQQPQRVGMSPTLLWFHDVSCIFKAI